VSGFPESDPGASGLHAQWYEANGRAGALTAQRCGCGVHRLPARYRCAACGSDAWSFEPVGPGGVIVSWTITRRPLHFAFADVVPYGIVVVRTPEDVRLLAQYRGDPATIGIGATVVLSVDRFGVPYAEAGA